MKTSEIQSVADFHRQVEETYSYHAIFRGEPKATFTLQSTFGRHMAANPKKNTQRTEMLSLEEFKRISIPHVSVEPRDDWEWLALAQHHGLSTRLIDWTSNPLVAAYFACCSPYAEDAVVYVLDAYADDLVDRAASPFDIQGPCVYRPRHTVNRISTQSGLFVAHDPKNAFTSQGLQRWVLKSDMLIDMKSMLDMYGARQSLMFPGLDSVCKEIHHGFIWGPER